MEANMASDYFEQVKKNWTALNLCRKYLCKFVHDNIIKRNEEEPPNIYMFVVSFNIWLK